MTEKQKLNRIINIIRGCGINLRIYQDKRRKCPQPNGVFFNNELKINLYCQSLHKNVSYNAAMLLHEFGHYLCYLRDGYDDVTNYHSEADAWDIVYEYIPKDLIPKNYLKIAKECVESYGEKYI